MTSPVHDTPSEEQINGYLDDELSAHERTMVENAANADAQLRERLRLDAAINEGLLTLFEASPSSPIPARLLNAIGPRPWQWWQRLSAAAACVCVGVLIGWNLAPIGTLQTAMSRPVSAEAAAAHAVYTREKRHTVEVRSNEREHLDRWLSKRLAHKFLAPDLRHHGLELIGGRLVADAGRPAALYMYERDDGERVTIYVRAQTKEAQPQALRFAQDRGFEVAHWADQNLTYAITGKIERASLRQVASSMHGQM
jgi:anti-sigma factor RsiW